MIAMPKLATLLILVILVTLAATAVPATAESLTAIEPRPDAPPLTLEDLDGHAHDLRDYRGRVVVVNFWATWCPPCRDELPSLQRLWEGLGPDGLVVLGVNVGEDADRIFFFTADYPVDFPLLLDRTASAIDTWPVRGIPTTFIIDPEGRIAYRAIGAREFDHPGITARLRELQQVQASGASPTE
ncbi:MULTISPECIES: TlpA disulfide reductase family protein [unclassified Thioalkalivibrio]|uniref:TlpA family protein disulfide reductase n=1 Tax=unclassified Thioalkalivibrio TaxID=2621013 RepID=UPI000377FF6F|nr:MULTISPECIES: TlpA disulfide reductase family protein [unclassified Thioalkalivibrio]